MGTFRSHNRGSFMAGALMLSAGVFAGCAADGGEIETSNGPTGVPDTFEEYKAKTFKEPWEGGSFIVNGDVAIHGEKQLFEYYEAIRNAGSELIVHQVGGEDAKWSNTQKVNLTYCVSNSFGTVNKPKVLAALEFATTNGWEKMANVDFKYVPAQDANCTASNQNVLFNISPVNVGGMYLARAFFPDSQRPDRSVLIDSSAFGNLGSWTLGNIVAHELGHTLGFRHEHTRPEASAAGCFEDDAWRPLTPYDSASIMHYPQCGGASDNLEFSSIDEQGASSLYGEGSGGPIDPPPPVGTKTASYTGTVAKNEIDKFQSISVKPGTELTVILSGTGDADLYVRFGAEPTANKFDCRPYIDGSSEECILTVPANRSVAYAQVRGYAAASYKIDVTWTPKN